MTVEVVTDGGACIRVAVSHYGYTHRLQGMDYYWWTSDEFGAYVERRRVRRLWETVARLLRRHECVRYVGSRATSYRCDTDRIVDTGGVMPPPTATVIAGGMVPDARARELGLL